MVCHWGWSGFFVLPSHVASVGVSPCSLPWFCQRIECKDVLLVVIMIPVAVLLPAYDFCYQNSCVLASLCSRPKGWKALFWILEGLVDAAKRWIFTHNFNDWGGDMMWMVLYFFLGALAAILLMYAPKLHTTTMNKSLQFLLKCVHLKKILTSQLKPSQPRCDIRFLFIFVSFLFSFLCLIFFAIWPPMPCIIRNLK